MGTLRNDEEQDKVETQLRSRVWVKRHILPCSRNVAHLQELLIGLVQAATLLSRIRDVAVYKIWYGQRLFVFSSVSPDKCRKCALNLSTIFKFQTPVNSLFTLI
jgi:hypothetical protein